MKTRELAINGMSCGHCVMAVRKHLSQLANVNVNAVEIGKATITIDETKVTAEAIAHAVEEAGYQLVGIR